MPPSLRRAAITGALPLALAGCAATPMTAGWDGRRGYDGRGDYGYEVDASWRGRDGAGGQPRVMPVRSYRVPGPPEDPWGPHIREASARFGVPERWIRAIMRQESGGRLTDASGGPITSPAGAMGLMQVMPDTYAALRARHRLGTDPYEPRDNILAGAAYIRDMHDRFGAPGFVAAYNAGPDRVAAYLAGTTILPEETVNYLASVVPALGIGASGAWAEQGGAGLATQASYAGVVGGDDPSLRAFDGGGLVGPGYPTGRSW